MAMTDNTTALEALRDQTAALPSAAKSVAGVAFGYSGATGDYAVSGEWLDNTATQIQSLTGATGGLTTTQMTEQLEVENQNVQNALEVLAVKGVTVPDGANSGNLVELIAGIDVGGGGGAESNCAVTVRVSITAGGTADLHYAKLNTDGTISDMHETVDNRVDTNIEMRPGSIITIITYLNGFPEIPVCDIIPTENGSCRITGPSQKVFVVYVKDACAVRVMT